MTTRTLALGDVVAGDILAADLGDSAGRLLLPRGTVLDVATLAGLARRGVDSLLVEAGEAGDTGVAPAARRAAVEHALRQRFRRAGDGDATRLLFHATLEHLLERQG